MAKDEAATASTALIEFSEYEAGIDEMQRQLRGVHFNLAIPKDDKAARQARAKLVTSRRAIEERRLDLNRQDRALVQGRIDARDAFAKNLIGLVAELEGPLDEAIKADEQRRADEKAAAERAEAERVAGIQRVIEKIRQFPLNAITAASDVAGIDRFIEGVSAIDARDESLFQEMTPIAALAKDQALTQLRKLREAAIQKEADARRAAEQQAELARLQEAERKRQAEAAEAQRAEAQRVAEANRKEQERLDAERAAWAREQAEATEARRREDREAFERQQRQEKAEREAAEKRRMLMHEIQGIQQQVIVAQLGRLGMRKGGTLECLQETLKETEAWKIEDDYFGDLASVARMARDAATGSIKKLIAEWKERAEAEAAAARQAEEARQLEVQRIEQDRKLYGAAKEMFDLLVILSSPDSKSPAALAGAKKKAQELIRKIGPKA